MKNIETDLIVLIGMSGSGKSTAIKALEDVWDLEDKDANYKRKKALATKIEAVQLQRLTELTTAVGTLYDKRALAKGDSTANNAITIKMDKEAEELAK